MHDIIYQDYESVSTNPFLTSSSDASTKRAMPGVPEIYTPSGYQDGNVAVMDYSRVTLSGLNESQLMYPRGIIYNGTPDKTDKLLYVPSMDDGLSLCIP